MKKILTAVICILAAASSVCIAADREHTLKVYNWADYIDEDLIEEFEQWYEEQTGEPVEIIYQLFKKPVFQNQYFILCTKNLFFILFQFLRYITLSIGQCLFSYPICWYFFFVGITNFQIISKYVIIGYFQAGYTSTFHFTLLNMKKIIFSFISHISQIIKFCIYAICNHSPLVD